MKPARLAAGSVLLLLASIALAPAQVSPSYRLEEYALNCGGDPHDGSIPTSPRWQISQHALGDGVGYAHVGSPSFSIEGGFVSAYPPPGEVAGLVFAGRDDLEWAPERSAGHYNLYRDPLSSLPGMGYGTCEQPGIAGAATTDSTLPAPGQGFFYLVTVANRLGHEGTKGQDSAGAPRPNPSPCP
jgi:hypothetical protein